MRTAFLGSPPFALPSFRALVEGGLAPSGLVTAPARRAGRGREEQTNELVTLAEAAGIPVLRPEKADDPEFLAAFAGWEVELGIVVAYGQILRPGLLGLARAGFVNVHGSLLPRWRGASPVQAAILAGDEESGVCVQRVVEKLDAGAVLAERRVFLCPDERADELFQRLADLGAGLLTEFVGGLSGGELPPGEEQDESRVTFCRKIRRPDGEMDWRESAVHIDRLVRAMYGWPWAQACLPDGRAVRVLAGEPQGGGGGGAAPGTVLGVEGGLTVACGSGVFRVDQLQLPGKRALPSAEFLRGTPLERGQLLRNGGAAQA